MAEGMTYQDAGVDVDAGNRAVDLIKGHVKNTFRKEVLKDIGGFAGFFQLDMAKYRNPVLVSGTDGVGTKLKLAFMMDKHTTIGIDAVAMCVNDILVHGAEPLFFLDYLAVGKLIPEKIEKIVKGVAQGCKDAGCALIGGETAEMPGMYEEDEYDIAGFAVGAVERDKIIDGSTIKAGDIIIGIASSGLHSNGFSLARKVVFEKAKLSPKEYIDKLGMTIGDAMLTPTKIYVKTVQKLSKTVGIKGMAHITGGGLIENLPRTLPQGLGAEINLNSWEVPYIFKFIQDKGNIKEREMLRTFNMGIGYTVIVSPADAEKALLLLKDMGNAAFTIGRMIPGEGGVSFCKN